MKICLFSKNYGALDGCAQSVFDVIVSLLESGSDLRVMYNKIFPDVREHDGFNIKHYQVSKFYRGEPSVWSAFYLLLE